MTKTVAVFCNFPDNNLGIELKDKLAKFDLEADMFGFQSSPTSNRLAARYAAAIIFTDLAAQTQVKRVRNVAENANLPIACLHRQAASWRADLEKAGILPSQETTWGSRIVQAIRGVEDDGRGLGWVRGSVENVPDSIRSVQEFLEWAGRLVAIPETCPPELLKFWKETNRSVPVPNARPSNPPASQPQPAPVVEAAPPVLSGVSQEEYDLLKEEYDTIVVRMSKLQEESELLRNANGSLISQVEELAKQLQTAVSAESLKKLSEQWREEGRKEQKLREAEDREELIGRISLLSKELEEADGREMKQEKALREATSQALKSNARIQELETAVRKAQQEKEEALGAYESAKKSMTLLQEIRRLVTVK